MTRTSASSSSSTTRAARRHGGRGHRRQGRPTAHLLRWARCTTPSRLDVPRLDYNIETDFVPVGLISSVPQVIVVNPQRVAANDLPGLLDTCAPKPGQVSTTARPATAPRTTWPARLSGCRPRPSSHISLPRRGPGAAGPDRRPGRHDVRRPGLLGHAHIKAAASRPSRWPATSARPASPTPPPKETGVPTYRSPPGTACGRQRARRRRWSSHAGRDEEGAQLGRAEGASGTAWAPTRPTSTAPTSASSSAAR